MRAAFRIDANDEIGWGHLVRGMAVAGELGRLGLWECALLTRSAVDVEGVRTVGIPAEVPPEGEGAFLAGLGFAPDVVVGDLRRPSQAQIDSLESGPWATVFVDDDSTVVFDCDALVDPNLNTVFEHRTTSRTAYLRGGDYVILRSQFDSLPAHQTRPELRHLLLCFGGTDPVGMTARVLDWYGTGGLPDSVERVSVVIGPEGARSLAPRVRDPRFVMLSGVSDMAALMGDADAGLIAAGTLAYEALASGLPSALIAIDESQAWEAGAIEGRGAGIFVGHAARVDREAVDGALARLASPDARSGVALCAQSVVDGGGRVRVADVIAAAAGRGRS